MFSVERKASGDMKGDEAERQRAPAGPEKEEMKNLIEEIIEYEFSNIFLRRSFRLLFRKNFFCQFSFYISVVLLTINVHRIENVVGRAVRDV